MTEEHIAQSLDSETQSFRAAGQQSLLCRRQLLGDPPHDSSILFRHGVCPSTRYLGQRSSLSIALDELDSSISRDVQQTIECFGGHWSGNHIAPDHYDLNFGSTKITEHSLEGRKVPVNVVEGSNPHNLEAKGRDQGTIISLKSSIPQILNLRFGWLAIGSRSWRSGEFCRQTGNARDIQRGRGV